MKNCFTISFVILYLSVTSSGLCQGLTLVIKGVKNDRGEIAAAIYKTEAEFMKTIWQAKETKAVKGEVHLVFENIPVGTYAISVMHDANRNGKLDTNVVGIPKEGFGFSNDVLGTFGPPSFDKASINLTGKDETIVINLKYY